VRERAIRSRETCVAAARKDDTKQSFCQGAEQAAKLLPHLPSQALPNVRGRAFVSGTSAAHTKPSIEIAKSGKFKSANLAHGLFSGTFLVVVTHKEWNRLARERPPAERLGVNAAPGAWARDRPPRDRTLTDIFSDSRGECRKSRTDAELFGLWTRRLNGNRPRNCSISCESSHVCEAG
jgi:hypothetical protein